MKKILALFLIAALCLCIAGCKKGSSAEETGTDPTQSRSQGSTEPGATSPQDSTEPAKKSDTDTKTPSGKKDTKQEQTQTEKGESGDSGKTEPQTPSGTEPAATLPSSFDDGGVELPDMPLT